MTRSKDLQREPVFDDEDLSAIIKQAEEPPPPPQPQPQPKATTNPYAANLDDHAAKARGHLALLIDILACYPQYRMSYSDCQFAMATMYAISVRHQLSPGQIKSLETLHKKATKARGDA